MTCNTADAMASRHALLSIPRMNEKEYQGTGIEVGIARGNGSSPVLSTANKIDEEYGNHE
jgi:hypothetical protein